MIQGPLVLQSHMAVGIVWFLYAFTVPLYQHCGYEIPYLFFLFPSASTHDFHHEKSSNQMYGKYGLMDYLFGTDQLWRQHRLKVIASGNGNIKKLSTTMKKD